MGHYVFRQEQRSQNGSCGRTSAQTVDTHRQGCYSAHAYQDPQSASPGTTFSNVLETFTPIRSLSTSSTSDAFKVAVRRLNATISVLNEIEDRDDHLRIFDLSNKQRGNGYWHSLRKEAEELQRTLADASASESSAREAVDTFQTKLDRVALAYHVSRAENSGAARGDIAARISRTEAELTRREPVALDVDVRTLSPEEQLAAFTKLLNEARDAVPHLANRDAWDAHIAGLVKAMHATKGAPNQIESLVSSSFAKGTDGWTLRDLVAFSREQRSIKTTRVIRADGEIEFSVLLPDAAFDANAGVLARGRPGTYTLELDGRVPGGRAYRIRLQDPDAVVRFQARPQGAALAEEVTLSRGGAIQGVPIDFSGLLEEEPILPPLPPAYEPEQPAGGKPEGSKPEDAQPEGTKPEAMAPKKPDEAPKLLAPPEGFRRATSEEDTAELAELRRDCQNNITALEEAAATLHRRLERRLPVASCATALERLAAKHGVDSEPVDEPEVTREAIRAAQKQHSAVIQSLREVSDDPDAVATILTKAVEASDDKPATIAGLRLALTVEAKLDSRVLLMATDVARKLTTLRHLQALYDERFIPTKTNDSSAGEAPSTGAEMRFDTLEIDKNDSKWAGLSDAELELVNNLQPYLRGFVKQLMSDGSFQGSSPTNQWRKVSGTNVSFCFTSDMSELVFEHEYEGKSGSTVVLQTFIPLRDIAEQSQGRAIAISSEDGLPIGPAISGEESLQKWIFPAESRGRDEIYIIPDEPARKPGWRARPTAVLAE